ncbi:MAG: hypothetical protein JO021_24170 [Alphaproteobacteria bacterium]|nr:hypothetical protein [Alphaproteobacteria bacterium]
MLVASRASSWSVVRGCAAVVALALASAASLADEGPTGPGDRPGDRAGRIGMLSGTVSVHAAGQSRWIAAVSERALVSGDGVWTQPGARAKVEFGRAAFELQEQTQVEVATLTGVDAELKLVQGALGVTVPSFGPGESWQVDTPRGAVRLMQPGSFLIEAGAGETPTRVTVIAGAAQVVGSESGLIVTAGQTGVVTGVDGGLSYAVQFTPATAKVEPTSAAEPDATPDQPDEQR